MRIVILGAGSAQTGFRDQIRIDLGSVIVEEVDGILLHCDLALQNLMTVQLIGYGRTAVPSGRRMGSQ
jgi:hypothetical protein